MNSVSEQVVTVAVAIVGVATLAVLVSRNSNTAGVIQAAGSAFSNALSVAVSPITGGGGGAGNVASNWGNW
jgi:hypothetical protein